jgi:hypothetical protein
MSRVMLHGVLNMPADIWPKDSPVDDIQRQARYVEASKLILKQDDMIAELEHALAMIEKVSGSVSGSAELLIKEIKAHNLVQHDKGVDKAIAELTICYRVALDEHKDYEDAEVLEGLIDRLQALKDPS